MLCRHTVLRCRDNVLWHQLLRSIPLLWYNVLRCGTVLLRNDVSKSTVLSSRPNCLRANLLRIRLDLSKRAMCVSIGTAHVRDNLLRFRTDMSKWNMYGNSLPAWPSCLRGPLLQPGNLGVLPHKYWRLCMCTYWF